jgi:membrane associated rhomboid family serine protease
MTLSLRPYALNDLPPVTKGLVAASFLGWVLELAFSGPLNSYFGLVPLKVIGFGWLWQPFTYIFIHAGFWHFIFNAFMLWMLGRVIEPVMGSRQFLFYFLLCGAAAGFCTVLASPGSTRAVIGASGAVYGLLYAFAALYPGQIIYMYFLFPMTARQFVALMAGLALVLSFATPNSTVANFTHLSGLAAGWAYFTFLAAIRRGPQGTGDAQEDAPVRSQVTELWAQATSGKFRFTHRSALSRVFGLFSRENAGPAELRVRVDAILEKISREGEGSLTASERRELDEYARLKGGKA